MAFPVIRGSLLVAMTIVSAIALPNRVQAQAKDDGSYKSVPIPAEYQNRAHIANQKASKDQVLLGRATLSDLRPQFTSWYRDYHFRRFTLPGERHALPDLRDDLANDFKKCMNAEAQRYLAQIAFDDMSTIATGNFHPAVRYNAMLVIGDLNLREASTVIDKMPAEPLPQALDFMIQQYKDPAQIEPVKLAAMIGMLRHVTLDRQLPQNLPMANDRKAEIIQLMRAVVTQADPPAGRTPEGHAWIQRRALDILGEIGYVGADGGVYNEFATHLTNKDALVSLRCTAAYRMGDLDYRGVSAVNPLEAAQKLAGLVIDFTKVEDERIKKELEAEKTQGTGTAGYPGGDEGFDDPGGGYPGGLGPGGLGPGGFGPAPAASTPTADPKLALARRRIKHVLECTLYGLRGELPQISRIGSAPQQPTGPLGGVIRLSQTNEQVGEVNKFIAAVDAIMAVTDPPADNPAAFTREELMKQVRTKVRDLEALMPQPAEPAAADPAADPTADPSADPTADPSADPSADPGAGDPAGGPGGDPAGDPAGDPGGDPPG